MEIRELDIETLVKIFQQIDAEIKRAEAADLLALADKLGGLDSESK